MEDEQFQLQPAQSPFEVAVILKEIFSKLKFRDLGNCRLVSRLWNCEASKQFWKVGKICCDWTEVAENTDDLLGRGEEVVKLTSSKEILNVFRSRNPTSRDSFVSVKIESTLSSAPEFYTTHCQDVGRTIHNFLTDPILCNLLASIELEETVDLDLILRILSEVPNLREFLVDFDVGSFVKTQSVVPKWHKTSPIKKLELKLSSTANTAIGDMLLDRFSACVSVILGGCMNMQDLRIVDETHATGMLLEVMEIDFLKASLKNPEIIERVALQSYDRMDVWDYVAVEKLEELINFFSEITHLDLVGWGQFDIDDWKTVISNNCLPTSLKSLRFNVCEFDVDIDSPAYAKFLYDHLKDAGLDRLQRLKKLRIDFYFGKFIRGIDGHWVEEWELVDERLALVRAKIPCKGRVHIDLRPHKHLRHLILLIGQTGVLTEVLKITPPTVKELDIGKWTSTIMMTDDDFRRDGALKAISGLERFRIEHRCAQCTTDVLKHVFAGMNNLRSVQLPGLQLTGDDLKDCGLENLLVNPDNFRVRKLE